MWICNTQVQMFPSTNDLSIKVENLHRYIATTTTTTAIKKRVCILLMCEKKVYARTHTNTFTP